MSKVQIIEYDRDKTVSLNFNETPEQNTNLFFKWFKIGKTRDTKLLRQGAKICMEYYNGQRWKLITGLISICEGVYYGDIETETAAILVSPDKELIKIILFKGHRPKYKTARAKKVLTFIHELKKQGIMTIAKYPLLRSNNNGQS